MGTTLRSTAPALGVLSLTAIVTPVAAATVPGRSTAGFEGAAFTAALATAGGAGWQ
ncbi:hypothetical protein [Streptosporangium sp. NPDC023615]|uniref:hypothetical protein n=1 Tax=Streptosporangium sp. NPDC023615 TaxID=3154794 RepID=UPI00341FE885